MKYLLFISLTLFSGLCSRFHSSDKDQKPLAQVGSSYLYQSDLKGLIKPKLNKDDSLSMVRSLIEKWIRKQLILQKAELNLNDDEKDVNKELEDYRTSLLIYKYEQKLITEKLDTVTNNDEVEKYYNQNKSNFTLNNDIVKAVYVKLPLKAPNIDQFKNWLKTENEENYKQLEKYCFQYAVHYDFFNDDWVDINEIRSHLPGKIADNEQLRTTKYLEAKDSAYLYFVNIKDFQAKGTISPLKLVEKDIRSIILLKRKQKLINDMENKIYFDAFNKNNFTIFD